MPPVKDADRQGSSSHRIPVAGAVTGSGQSRPAVPALHLTAAVPAAIVQRRLPELTQEFIEKYPPMARELIVHAFRNLSPAAKEDIQKEVCKEKCTVEDLINSIKNEGATDELWNKYRLVRDFTDEQKKLPATLDLPDLQENIPGQQQLLNQFPGLITQLTAVIAALDNTHSNVPKVFGISAANKDLKNHVIAVFKSIIQQLADAASKQTLPFALVTESSHNEWAGIGGLAPKNNEVVKFPSVVIDGIKEGSLVYLALLVHELSHKATPATSDITNYSLESIKLLTPVQRINNAESYAQAYLEQVHQADPLRYYDPSLFIENKQATESARVISSRHIINSAINTFLRELWVQTNDAYNYEKQIYNQLKKTTQANQSKEWITVQACVYPHTDAVKDYPNEVRAILEDRSRALCYRINTPEYINHTLGNYLQEIEASKEILDTREELKKVLPWLLKEPFNMTQDQVETFVTYWVQQISM